MEYEDTIFEIFEKTIAPIMLSEKASIEEPIQQEPYIPLLRMFT